MRILLMNLAASLMAATSLTYLMAPEGGSGAAPLSDPETGLLGYSGQKTMVHKEGHEGVLIVDTFSGLIYPASIHADQTLPDWATEKGLVSANLAERVIYYGKRLDKEAALKLTQSPEAIAFEDLEWMTLEEPAEGDTQPIEGTLEADEEWRMDNMAKLLVGLQIDRDPDAKEPVKGADLHVEVASDRTRTKAEADALEEAQRTRFEKTGTGE